MTILNISYTKLHVEKTGKHEEKMQVANNIAVTGVASKTITLASPTPVASIGFRYELQYQPTVGQIIIEGELTMLLPKPELDQVVQSYAKDKKLAPQLMEQVVKSVFTRCQMQAILLAREIALPSPFPLPRLNVQPKKKK